MEVEEYTLILKHEYVVGDNKIQIDEPIIMKMCADRSFMSGGINLNAMLDRFTHEVLQRSAK